MIFLLFIAQNEQNHFLHIDFWDEYLYILVVLSKYRGNSSVVEHCLAKARVAGSNPVSRSIFCGV